MRLIFLGTGPALAIPRLGHRDPLCREARRGGRSRRTRSAAVLETPEATILIDAGPDIRSQLRRQRIRCLDLVVLTHGHSDAVAGLRDLSRWLSARTPHGIVPVFTDVMTQRRLKTRFPKLPGLEIIAVKPYSRIRIGRLMVRPFRVRHSLTPGFPTSGYVFNRRLAYASDAVDLPPRSRRLLRGVKTLVFDGAMYLRKPASMHSSADASIRLAHTLRARHLILTQIGHSYPPLALALHNIKQYHKNLRVALPKTVKLAWDGLRLRV